MKKSNWFVFVLGIFSVSSSYAVDDKQQVEKIFRANMDVSYACPSEKQHREAHEIVTRNISKLSGTRDSSLTKLKAAEPMIRKAIIFEVKDSDELKSYEVDSYLVSAKAQVQRCKELSFLLSNF